MPSQTRKRRPRSAKSQTRKRHRTSRSGLNKTEKKETVAIAKKVALSTTEMKWCNPYSYDNYADYDAPRQNAPLEAPWMVNGVYIGGQSATVLALETGTTLSTQGSNLNAALNPTGVGNNAINMIGMYNFAATNDAAADAIDPSLLREGEYMYAHAQRVDVEIDMRKLEDASVIKRNPAPYEFRVVALKRKPRRVIATGAGPDFRTELFRNYANAPVGLLNGMSVKQLMEFKINRECFTVDKDFKFKLSSPIDPTAAVSQPTNAVYTFPNTGNTYNSFPNSKKFSLYLPKPKQKIKWEGSQDGDPDDSFNYKWNLFVFATQTGSEDMQNIASQWIMKVQTESKFRDC